MGVEQHATARRINYTLLTFLLLLAAGILGALVWIAARSSGRAGDDETARRLMRLAWAASTMLGLVLILLAWVAFRWLRLRLGGVEPLPETPYVDAWAEAGRRAKPIDSGGTKIDVQDED